MDTFFVGINGHSVEKGLSPKVSRLEMRLNRLLRYYYKRSQNNRTRYIMILLLLYIQLLRFYFVSPIFAGFEQNLERHYTAIIATAHIPESVSEPIPIV